MKSSTLYWLLLGFFGSLAVALSIYSYAHVDLNLTLSSAALYQQVQAQLTALGYFNRPLSTALFICLLVGLAVVYVGILWLSKEKKISAALMWKLVGISFILLIAYPSFSHDFFNYLFDARILTKYGLNPYYFNALDFPLDPWTRFMHWTHRYYPYGPGWLPITLFPSFLGFGKFLPTLFLFKGMFVLFHGINCWLIYQLSKKLNPIHAVFTVSFYAFNPLVIIESLISPHNEVVMLTGVLAAFYPVLLHKNKLSLITLVISASIKYLSIALLPLWYFWRRPATSSFFAWAWGLWLLSLVPVIVQRELYSWYFIPVIALAAFTQNLWIQALTVGASVGLLMRYIPFILTGEYSSHLMIYQYYLLGIGLCIGVITYSLAIKR